MAEDWKSAGEASLLALLWSLGSFATCRKQFDEWARNNLPGLADQECVFDFFVQNKKQMAWQEAAQNHLDKTVIHTREFISTGFFISLLAKAGQHTLIIGRAGSGKSTLAASVASSL